MFDVDGMRVALTGGGTGGHVYPAVEVGRLARDSGAVLSYVGSVRGQEGAVCKERGIPFVPLPSAPLYSLRTARGLRSLVSLLRAVPLARKELRRIAPDRVFSTGGFSAAPVMYAARGLRIPYVIHESNSIPGRSNRMFASSAHRVSCSFHRTLDRLPNAVRTGQPIRKELRSMVQKRSDRSPDEIALVLIVGGSQGSAFLNELILGVAALSLHGVKMLLSCGPTHEAEIAKRLGGLGDALQVAPFLSAEALSSAYSSASVAVGRSGGTVAEFAMSGLPSVLVPLPTSADDHQLENAREFAEFGGATILEQRDASPGTLTTQIQSWLVDREKLAAASRALLQWDVPDASERILELIAGPQIKSP